MSKVFESVFLDDFITVAEGDELQYGFKHGLSTDVCRPTNVLKTTGGPLYIRILSYWYSHKLMDVRWHSKVSDHCLKITVSALWRRNSLCECRLRCIINDSRDAFPALMH